MVRSASYDVDTGRLDGVLEQPLFHAVSQVARETAIPTYIVGGHVRDLLLDRNSKDLDFVVEGDGIAFAEKVAELLMAGHVNVFKNFGTAMFRYEDMDVEFVGARKESYARESRKPNVEPGSIRDDQERRDFTINAMALSLNEGDHGALIDPFHGVKDLEEGIIRTPLNPDITFSDDPLRMMRAIRFSSELGMTITPECMQAIRRNKDRIAIVSMERVSTELNKIIASPVPSVGFRQLFDTGLLKLILPEMCELHGVEEKNGVSHKDNFYHTLQVLDNVAKMSDDVWLRWGAILHDIAKPRTKRFDEKAGWTFHGHEDRGARMVPGIFRRLKLPLDSKMKFVQKLVLLHLRPIALTKEEVTDSAIRRLLYDAGDDIDALMLLCNADITSKNEKRVKRYLANYELVREKLVEVEEKDRLRNWQPPVSGEDIMAAFGIGPCREIGDIKNAIREAILDGLVKNDRREAWEFMVEKGKVMGLTPVKGLTFKA